MKFIYTFCICASLLACTSKSTSENTTADSASVVKDSVIALPTDTVKEAENAETVQPVVAEVKPEKKDPSKKVLRCQYKSLEVEEETGCTHIIFDCGDFGLAVTSSLPAVQKKLFESLMSFEGHGDWPVANPAYLGKTFEITHNYALGNTCERDANGEQVKKQVPNILFFKLIAD